MPWIVKKGRGSRPWKIVREDTGQVVGSSMTEEQARASVRARYAKSPEARRAKSRPNKGLPQHHE